MENVWLFDGCGMWLEMAFHCDKRVCQSHNQVRQGDGCSRNETLLLPGGKSIPLFIAMSENKPRKPSRVAEVLNFKT